MENRQLFIQHQLEVIQMALDSDKDPETRYRIIQGLCMLSDRPLTQKEKDYALELVPLHGKTK